MNIIKAISIFSLLSIFFFSAIGQHKNAKGTLFIIGGGTAGDTLQHNILKEANWQKHDGIVVVTLASSIAEESFEYNNDAFKKFTGKECTHFDSASIHDAKKIDALKKAKIIYLGGGAQDRFMHLIENTQIGKIISEAYRKGALIAGTSAGAAVMSKMMITGNGLIDTAYASTFKMMKKGNLEITTGLGLLDSVIIDQHFVVRSRYNRLLSAQFEFPSYQCIGIDESTAIIIKNNVARVTGEGQVLLFNNARLNHITHTNSFNGSASISIFSAGNTFPIKN